MYETILWSTGNLDHGQYVASSPLRTVMACLIKDTAEACRKYIESGNLGGGKWCDDAGKVYKSGKLVATISYNGRVVAAE